MDCGIFFSVSWILGNERFPPFVDFKVIKVNAEFGSKLGKTVFFMLGSLLQIIGML